MNGTKSSNGYYNSQKKFCHAFSEDLYSSRCGQYLNPPLGEIAEDLGRPGGHELGIEDLRGGNVLERAKKYYELVLHFPLMTASSNEEPIRMLLSVRNAIAHANGRLEMIKPSEFRKIDEWEKSATGLSTDFGHLSYSAVFVKDMIQTVTSFLEDLISRVKEHNQIQSIDPA